MGESEKKKELHIYLVARIKSRLMLALYRVSMHLRNVGHVRKLPIFVFYPAKKCLLWTAQAFRAESFNNKISVSEYPHIFLQTGFLGMCLPIIRCYYEYKNNNGENCDFFIFLFCIILYCPYTLLTFINNI